MVEIMKWRNINIEECSKNYRRLRNELERATDNDKKNILRTYVTKLWNFKKQDVTNLCACRQKN